MGKRRLKIQDVHERTGLSRTTVSALYNDTATRIDFSTIERLCLLFECDVNELLSLDPTKSNTVSTGGKADV
jgi:DNA-binding Xre family transcriptional regulator